MKFSIKIISIENNRCNNLLILNSKLLIKIDFNNLLIIC